MRKSWHRYFMNIAMEAATRATCPRKPVGAVLVNDKTIISTGYNGSVRGLPHCTEAGCMMEDNHCARTIHAEVNTIVQAAKNGVRVDGSTLYVTAGPCWQCFKMVVNAGIKRVVFQEFCGDQRIFDTAQQLGIELFELKENEIRHPDFTVKKETAHG